MIAMQMPFLRSVLILVGALAGKGGVEAAAETWEPVGGVVPPAGFVVDTANRLESLYFYQAVYMASEGAENRIGWTSSYGACTPGTTAADFRVDVQRRVNFYRALCGLPADITFDAEPAVNEVPLGSPLVGAGVSKRNCAQAAAYNNAFSNVFFEGFGLTHNPTPLNTSCFSANAWNGAFNSNLTIGYFGPRAVDVYMADDNLQDDRSNNSNVGHRRFVLNSQARDMSTGDVPPGNFTSAGTSYPILPANALYIVSSYKASHVPPKQFVTWPPSGYVPVQMKPLRWSISFPGAVFPAGNSSIKLTGPTGGIIPVTVISANEPNKGDNTLVFLPQQTNITGSADAPFSVTITGMSGPGVPGTHTWTSTFFDPTVLGVDQTVTGPAQPSAAGADYQSAVIPFASSYELLVNPSPPSPATYVENGDGATPDITTDKTGTYPLLQGYGTLPYRDPLTGLLTGTSTFTPRSGAKSLHLCFPTDKSEVDSLPHNQSFGLGSEFIPSTTSAISFQELFRWLFTVNRMSLEISTDGGSLWSEIYGRNGKTVYKPNPLADPKLDYKPSDWDTTWNLRSVSLAAYAGRPVRLRFMLRHNDLAFDTADIDHGCYIDDINITGVRRLSTGVKTIFPTPTLRLDSRSAGRPLVVGDSYLMRVRAKLGASWMGYSPLMTVTVTARPPTGFEEEYPALAASPQGDADGDGISNYEEFCFGLNPLSPNSPAALPQPALTGGKLIMAFDIPTRIKDVAYIGQCSSNLSTWTELPNTGTASRPSFAVPVAVGQNCYIRLKVEQKK